MLQVCIWFVGPPSARHTNVCVYNVFFNVSSVVIIDLEQMSFYALAEMKGVINAESAFAE